VEIWAFKYSLANALKEQLEEDRIFYIDDLLNKIKL